MRATFRKSERLKRKKLLEEVYQKGKPFRAFPFILLHKHCEIPGGAPLQLAISVPKRRVRLAVDRNRIKRQVREAFRLNKAAFVDALRGSNIQLGLLLIFVGNTNELSSELVHQKISELIARLEKELKHNHTEQITPWKE